MQHGVSGPTTSADRSAVPCLVGAQYTVACLCVGPELVLGGTAVTSRAVLARNRACACPRSHGSEHAPALAALVLARPSVLQHAATLSRVHGDAMDWAPGTHAAAPAVHGGAAVHHGARLVLLHQQHGGSLHVLQQGGLPGGVQVYYRVQHACVQLASEWRF